MFLTFELFYIVERCSKWVWSRSKFCWSCTISLFDKNSFYRVVVWVWTNKYKYGSKYLLFPKRANANTVWQLWWYFPTIKKKIKENFCWYCREKTKIGKYIWKSVFFLKKGYAFRNSVTWILCSTNEIDEKFANELLHVGAWEKTNVLELDVEKISLMPFL